MVRLTMLKMILVVSGLIIATVQGIVQVRVSVKAKLS